MLVNATGAQGGEANDAGGLGGWVIATLSVTAGQTLYIFVGGDTLVGGGYNGGGKGCFGAKGGGGGTDIRTNANVVQSRLIAVGGGGGGSGWNSDDGGSGGTMTVTSLSSSLFR